MLWTILLVLLILALFGGGVWGGPSYSSYGYGGGGHPHRHSGCASSYRPDRVNHSLILRLTLGFSVVVGGVIVACLAMLAMGYI